MIVHIQDAKSPKQAWDTLVKMYNTNTQALQNVAQVRIA
jgi:hypothetical protein